ncbi:xanthine dehydrogenase family protein molybdopterin-binding subunit [Candidatus Formimonas warabiya]|uniref:Aldehyde oxidase/xanthine dehydrogenase a/b hammerhead domain-containing protein n=1 Tax=Formimonas warabiya TaxID=1761012 RepID=A0A3G1KSP6_FORW1|nr:xanthine dehydrogenase family protein molybdopterin-binding subunit [Candidatus Formimonas warabiya]ATW25450.1 hypothetical protein DCMF_12280 [Candidatus Formimonas warabiya]
MTGYKTIGKSTPFIDAAEKVTGRAVYTTDMKFPNMLYGKILRSTIPHGRIVGIDTSEAEKLPGVEAVITAKDTPLIKFGIFHEDWYILAHEKVRFAGDEVAAVAAINEDIAGEALKLIKVHYEELPAVFDPKEAAQPDAVDINGVKNNIASKFHVERGNVDQAFEESHLIIEKDFYTTQVYQAYMETMAAVVKPEDNGRLTFYLPIQIPSKTRVTYAKALGMKIEDIHVIQPTTGGGFGAKMETVLHLIAAVLAQKTGKPVRIINTREEDFEGGNPRVPMHFHVKMGFSKEGMIKAKDLVLYAGAGGRACYGVPVLGTACFRHDQLYKYENVRANGYLVYTNMVPSGCFRGFGNSQGTFCIECIMDEAAEKLGIDPADIRLRNAVYPGFVSCHGWVINSCLLQECITKAVEAAQWQEKRKEKKSGRGIGLACCNHVSGYSAFFPPFHGSAAVIRMNMDGKFLVMSGEIEIGQGQKTAFAMMAAEALDVPLENVRMAPIDTDYIPFGLGCWASRSTALGGKAIQNAAEDLKGKILQFVSQEYGIAVEQLSIANGVVVNTQGEEITDLSEIGRKYLYKTNGSYLYGQGYVDPGTVVPDMATKMGNPSITYPFACHIAEVDVDVETGVVKVIDYVAAHDVGKVINPMGAEGQIEGGVAMGIGWALTENMVYQNGVLKNSHFLDYRLPGSKDVPDMKSIFLESNDPNTGFGSKGLGEPAINPVVPAIANAIHDAVGIRLTELPFTPDKVLKAIQEKKKNKEGEPCRNF